MKFFENTIGAVIAHFLLRVVRGVALVLPLLCTIGALFWMYSFYLRLTTPLLTWVFGFLPDWLSEQVPIYIGHLLLITLLYGVGGGLLGMISKWILDSIYSVFIARLPVASQIWSTVKQLSDHLEPESGSEKQYDKTVIVRFSPTFALLGFMTRKEYEILNEKDWCIVLLATSPLPYTGLTIFVKPGIVESVDVTWDEALRLFASAGISGPEMISKIANSDQAIVIGDTATLSSDSVSLD
jgi:uncharacterized membrane protein